MIEPANIIVSCLKDEQGQVYLPVRKVDGQVEYLKVLVEGSNIQLLSDTLKSSVQNDNLSEIKQEQVHSKITRKEFEDKKIEYLFRMGYIGKYLVAGVLHNGAVKTINVEISPSANLNSTLLSYIDMTNPDKLVIYSSLDHVLAGYTFSRTPDLTYEHFKSVETNMSIAKIAEVNMPAIEAKLNLEGIYIIEPLNILI